MAALKILKPKVPGMACPHCGDRAIARSSREITPLCRELRYVCVDDECGHVFTAQLAITHSTRLSAKSRPGVDLPYRPAPGTPGALASGAA